jgi:predicted TIM-barrel fold metal-dependent hydrolase
MKKIDAHAHIGYIGGWADVGIDKEGLIKQMDQYEIEKTALCCEDNDKTLDAMKTYPGRFIGCVYVNPLKDNAVDLIDKYTAEGFKAVKLNPLRHAYCADAEIVDPVIDAAGRHGIPVCIHSGHPPYSLPWQEALLAERHPNVKIMMIHMGHGHGVYIDAALKMARRLDNVYLEMSGMPMPSKIREAYETVGSGRIMFGTDSPFHDPSVEIQKVKVCGVDDEGLQRIFYDNAAKFFAV